MQIETYLPTKSVVLIITCDAINTLKQSLTLTNTLLEKLKSNTLGCYGDFEDFVNTEEIILLLVDLEEITRLPSILSG